MALCCGGMRLWTALPLAASLLTLAGCKNSSPSEQKPGPGAQPAASARLPGLVKKYKAMSTAERLQAAKNGCYVSQKCDALETKALLASAGASGKVALQAAARPVFAEQYEKELVDKGKKPDSVTATGDDDATLTVKGPPCNRFLLSNFMNDLGNRARALGFKHVACENKALKAKIDL